MHTKNEATAAFIMLANELGEWIDDPQDSEPIPRELKEVVLGMVSLCGRLICGDLTVLPLTPDMVSLHVKGVKSARLARELYGNGTKQDQEVLLQRAMKDLSEQ
jgi:hypothetical protein